MEGDFFCFLLFFSFLNSVKPANGPQPRKVLWSVILPLLPAPSVCTDQNKHNIGAVSHRLLECVWQDGISRQKWFLFFFAKLGEISSSFPALLMTFLNSLRVHIRRFNVIYQNNRNFSLSTPFKKQLSGTFFNDFFSNIRFTFRIRTKGCNHEFLTLMCIRGSTLKKYNLNLHYPASLSHFIILLA